MTGGHVRWLSVEDDASAGLFGGRVDQRYMRGRRAVTLSDMEGLSFVELSGLEGGRLALNVLAATISGAVISRSWLGGRSFSLLVYGVDDSNFASRVSVVAVPEPATWSSMVSGLGALVGVRRRATLRRGV